LIEPSAKFEDLKVPLRDPVQGVSEVSAVLGTPEWWPTGSRVAVAMAHSASGDLNDPLLTYLHRELTARKCLTLRFNFPFAEAGKSHRGDVAEELESAFRSALSVLGRDPTAAPAHLFIGGLGLGAKVAAQMASAAMRIDGLFCLGFPLHPQGKPEKASADMLYRIIAPMLFVQGLRDRSCDIDTLRRCLQRVGAPTRLNLIEEADAHFRVTRKSGIDVASVHAAVLQSVSNWIDSVVRSV